MEQQQICGFCEEKPATKLCSGCRSVAWCGARCRDDHWHLAGHDKECAILGDALHPENLGHIEGFVHEHQTALLEEAMDKALIEAAANPFESDDFIELGNQIADQIAVRDTDDVPEHLADQAIDWLFAHKEGPDPEHLDMTDAEIMALVGEWILDKSASRISASAHKMDDTAQQQQFIQTDITRVESMIRAHNELEEEYAELVQEYEMCGGALTEDARQWAYSLIEANPFTSKSKKPKPVKTKKVKTAKVKKPGIVSRLKTKAKDRKARQLLKNQERKASGQKKKGLFSRKTSGGGTTTKKTSFFQRKKDKKPVDPAAAAKKLESKKLAAQKKREKRLDTKRKRKDRALARREKRQARREKRQARKQIKKEKDRERRETARATLLEKTKAVSFSKLSPSASSSSSSATQGYTNVPSSTPSQIYYVPAPAPTQTTIPRTKDPERERSIRASRRRVQINKLKQEYAERKANGEDVASTGKEVSKLLKTHLRDESDHLADLRRGKLGQVTPDTVQAQEEIVDMLRQEGVDWDKMIVV